MLVNAMEVSGIEGSYRITCERTMGVLRDNKDSLLAMLEAFVHDPLFSWRLLGEQTSNQEIETPGVVASDDLIPSKGETSSTLVFPSAIEEGQNEDSDEEVTSVDTGKDKNFISSRDRRRASMTVIAESHKAKSLQIYSHIQSLAANLTTSSRIASITEGNTANASTIGGSIAKSRLDKSIRQRDLGEDVDAKEEELNEKAVKVIQRVQDKLSGTDFPGPDGFVETVSVEEQVELLIAQASSSENLCQLFIGWCAFW